MYETSGGKVPLGRDGGLGAGSVADWGLPSAAGLGISGGMLRGKLHQVAGDAGGVVASDSVFFEVVAEHGNDAEFLDGVKIVGDLARTFQLVLSQEFRGNRRAVDERVIEKLLLGVAVEGADVIGGSEIQAFVGLGHQVADVDLDRLGRDDCLRNAPHQQVGNQAGEQRARTDGDEIRVGDGFERLRHGLDVRRNEEQFADASLAGSDFCFAAHAGAIFHESFKFDVGSRGGMNVSAGEQNLGRQAHGFGEIGRDGSKRGEKQVSEAVAFEPGAFFKTMAEEFRQQSFVFAEGYDAIADVTGRQHVELFAQAAAGAPVVADGDYGAKIADHGRVGDSAGNFGGGENKFLQSLEQGGKAGPTTNGDYAQTTLARTFLRDRGSPGFNFHQSRPCRQELDGFVFRETRVGRV